MGYIGRRMSTNAEKAYKMGLLPRSKFSKKLLVANGWTYSAAFFNWLCKEGYIVPLEYHHTTPKIKCTPFYALSTISYAIDNLDLESLYEVYLHKCTLRDILRKKCVQRVKILVNKSVLGTNCDVYLDCLLHNNLYWWSKDKCFKVNTNDVALIKIIDLDDFSDWYNPNREKIERQICIRKKMRINTY